MINKIAKMEKRMRQLQRRYPKNKYTIEEKAGKKGKLTAIVRIRDIGRRPHKISHK
jgi:hypothetical protein